jgi:8-oxo-dGTP pyrophosphatase MutT (NUDIX family)
MNNQLPENAKLVFKGQLFEVWQWEQKMFDGSTHTFERVKRPDTVEVVATHDNKILLTKQEQPYVGSFLSLPGGVADGGGTPLEEVQRELIEETGYGKGTWEPWLTLPSTMGRVLYTYRCFVARDVEQVQEPHLDPGEKITFEWISFDDFLLLSDNPEFRGYGIVKDLLLARVHKEKREALHQLLFPLK